LITLLARRKRQLLFVCVGATCFLAQYGALTAMSAAGASRPLANALGFVLSAQLNFALSARYTWRDRPGRGGRIRLARLLSYNATALLALTVNTVAFTVTYHRLGNLGAAAFGVLCGMCVTYLVCDRLIFRGRGRRTRAAARHAQPAHPALPRPTLPRPTLPRPGRAVPGRHRSDTAWEQS
jgi:putative flippase GtrA